MDTEQNPTAIGIDLGTTYSCVAATFPNGGVQIIENDLGHRTTPSIVAFTSTQRYIGESARTQAHENPTNTVFDVKRLMGRKFDDDELQKDIAMWPFNVVCEENKLKVSVDLKNKKMSFTPEEISAMILEQMKTTAEARLETTVTEAVIAVPAYFNDAQRKATIDAGRIAGLKVLRIINEPTAAALCYGYQKNIKDARNILVIDLGGGTFDVSIVKVQNGKFTVRAVAGNTHLGGEDFTNQLVKSLVSDYKRKHNKDILANKKALSRLRSACELVKRDLSHQNVTKIALDAFIDGEDYAIELSRSRLENINKKLFDDTLETVKEALANAKMIKSDIHDVLLVGGSTRIPQIKRLLQEFFDGRNLRQGVNPDEAVAHGAAILATMIQENKGDITEKVTLSDVTPLSLGIETEGGTTTQLIPRNTPIPANYSKMFPTSSSNQTDVKISVYEGEREMFADNHILGTFVLRGLPPAPKGAVKLNVTFDIDVNGSLTVSAVDASGGLAKNQIAITSDQGKLSEQDISRMIEDAKKYKAEDEKQKARALSKTMLCDYIDTIASQIEDNFLNKIAEIDKKKVLDFCKEISEWLEELPREVDECKNKKKDLEQIWFPIVTKLLN